MEKCIWDVLETRSYIKESKRELITSIGKMWFFLFKLKKYRENYKLLNTEDNFIQLNRIRRKYIHHFLIGADRLAPNFRIKQWKM